MRTMNQDTKDHVTRNFMQFCYTCDEAHLCTNEEQCRACWADKGLLDHELDGANETQNLLLQYYA